jgi:3-deoxy-D-manno-octulosonic-acid transferase
VAAVFAAPVWLPRMIRTGKIRTDWRGRFGGCEKLPILRDRPRILIHAVSVGEVNAIRMLVSTLARSQQNPEIVIASTTDTGFARAKSLWGDSHAVVRYPFDASWSVRRFLNAIRPNVAVLTELEVWPNFTADCSRRCIPIVVINGRLTQRSLKRYRMIRGLIQPTFRRLTCVAAQNQEYAQRFITLGVRASALHITGTMKWDTAQIADCVAGADELADAMQIDRGKLLVVAGSTAPDEHSILHRAVPAGVQLLCAPRKPEWFEQAARDLPGCVRRSAPQQNGAAGGDRFLLDSIGELRQAYALADVVVVGRSFGNLHGSDMMEPIALGKATIVGPAVADFQDTVDALLAGEGLVQTTAAELPKAIRTLLDDEDRRSRLASNGREVIRAHQGASERNAALILSYLERPSENSPDRRDRSKR